MFTLDKRMIGHINNNNDNKIENCSAHIQLYTAIDALYGYILSTAPPKYNNNPTTKYIIETQKKLKYQRCLFGQDKAECTLSAYIVTGFC